MHTQQPTIKAPPVEEAERAATKIQAGFKGYKTRKELEGKLGPSSGLSSAGGQQMAPAAADHSGGSQSAAGTK